MRLPARRRDACSSCPPTRPGRGRSEPPRSAWPTYTLSGSPPPGPPKRFRPGGRLSSPCNSSVWKPWRQGSPSTPTTAQPTGATSSPTNSNARPRPRSAYSEAVPIAIAIADQPLNRFFMPCRALSGSRSVQLGCSPRRPVLEVILPALLYPISRLIDAALIGELSVIGRDGSPITYPMVPLLWGDRIFLTSSVLDSSKVAHIEANPRVSFSITNMDAMGTYTGRVTIQCDARVSSDDLTAGWERLLDNWRRIDKATVALLKSRVGFPLI